MYLIHFLLNLSKLHLFSQKVFRLGNDSHNYEAICFSIYFSLKYDFEIGGISADAAILSDSCLLKLFTFLYYTIYKSKDAEKKLKDHARLLASNEDDFNRNWLFVYEVLSQSDLKGE